MEKEYSYKMKKEKIDQIRSKLFNSKLIHLPDNGGDCFETANVMRYINSVEAIISEQKAEIERLRKALTDITALDVSTNKNSFEDDFAMCVSIASNTLTKKEGNNG